MDERASRYIELPEIIIFHLIDIVPLSYFTQMMLLNPQYPDEFEQFLLHFTTISHINIIHINYLNVPQTHVLL